MIYNQHIYLRLLEIYIKRENGFVGQIVLSYLTIVLEGVCLVRAEWRAVVEN